ncbi:protein EPIDERMAL PATTERNING FACTOR 2-like isoform X2 [Malania oleifera]|uniref:protein EPIDERMAL PATTERNING FACTOR 2-like isoform X2 n=1 Tax=Malania oleifera TaxID=397392 RepID=UPI0025ADF2DC|nr:protein EPIDERMAL PATTERNING FACTOR 2-like isoform X2 [Malania oleifera]
MNSSIGARQSFLLAILFTVTVMLGASLHLSPHHRNGNGDGGGAHVLAEPEVYPTSGSRLPDCTHACGACFPCKRVTVSFKCSVAESCPIVYRCMCKGKYYHVPSN